MALPVERRHASTSRRRWPPPTQRGVAARRSPRRAPIDGRPREIEAAHLLDHVPFFNIFEMTIDDADVLDRRVRESAQVEGVRTLLARHALELDVARDRFERTLVALFIEKVDRKHRVGDLAHG